MIVWVKLGEDDAADITISGKERYFSNLKTAIKSIMPNTFLTTDANKIVIKDPWTNVKIASTEPLTLTLVNGNKRGTVTIPFIVKDPRLGILGNAYPFLYVITFHLFSIPHFIAGSVISPVKVSS